MVGLEKYVEDTCGVQTGAYERKFWCPQRDSCEICQLDQKRSFYSDFRNGFIYHDPFLAIHELSQAALYVFSLLTCQSAKLIL